MSDNFVLLLSCCKIIKAHYRPKRSYTVHCVLSLVSVQCVVHCMYTKHVPMRQSVSSYKYCVVCVRKHGRHTKDHGSLVRRKLWGLLKKKRTFRCRTVGDVRESFNTNKSFQNVRAHGCIIHKIYHAVWMPSCPSRRTKTRSNNCNSNKMNST